MLFDRGETVSIKEIGNYIKAYMTFLSAKSIDYEDLVETASRQLPRQRPRDPRVEQRTQHPRLAAQLLVDEVVQSVEDEWNRDDDGG